MAALMFLTHIPLLRIDEEELPFADGALWRVPFEIYDQLSLGAFSDHQQKYEGTAPVFFRYDIDLDLPVLEVGEIEGGAAIEIKMPSHKVDFLAQIGLGFVSYFYDTFVDRVWKSLVLAAPGACLPSPRLSTSFVYAFEGSYFHLGDIRGQTIHIQGDADQEYLFLPEAAGDPLPAELIERAVDLLSLEGEISKSPELAQAQEMLLAATAPPLSAMEQLTLAVIGLEALLLPEVRSGLGETFARRVGALVGTGKKHFVDLRVTAKRLYDLRSAGLHGELALTINPDEPAVAQGFGPQLLSGALRRLTGRIAARELAMADLRPLDRPEAFFDPAGEPLPLAEPPGLRRVDRLSAREPSMAAVFTSAGAMHAEEGMLLSWSPLVGLSIAEVVGIDQRHMFMMMPLNGAEVVALEEKDIARDFISRIRVDGRPIACLAASTAAADFMPRAEPVAALHRLRDLAVVALRLAGYDKFIDPELLGWYLYVGKMRFRKPTVLRQTILQLLMNEPEEEIQAADMARVEAGWQLLAGYDAAAVHPEIEHILTMYRRAHDRRFIPVQARAGLLLSVLEGMLGRFRPKKEPVQLEALAAAAAGEGSEAVEWFRREGRGFRNAVAHGTWRPAGGEEEEVELEHLLALCGGILPVLVERWLALDERAGQRPGRVLIEQLAAEHGL